MCFLQNKQDSQVLSSQIRSTAAGSVRVLLVRSPTWYVPFESTLCIQIRCVMIASCAANVFKRCLPFWVLAMHTLDVHVHRGSNVTGEVGLLNELLLTRISEWNGFDWDAQFHLTIWAATMVFLVGFQDYNNSYKLRKRNIGSLV